MARQLPSFVRSSTFRLSFFYILLFFISVAALLLILLGMPAFAAIVGWLFAGREPVAIAHHPMD